MTDADLKAWCAQHGINTVTHDGQICLDLDGMRAMADHAPNPARAHAILDQMLTETHDRE